MKIKVSELKRTIRGMLALTENMQAGAAPKTEEMRRIKTGPFKGRQGTVVDVGDGRLTLRLTSGTFIPVDIDNTVVVAQ